MTAVRIFSVFLESFFCNFCVCVVIRRVTLVRTHFTIEFVRTPLINTLIQFELLKESWI
jgi:hypothetical protein